MIPGPYLEASPANALPELSCDLTFDHVLGEALGDLLQDEAADASPSAGEVAHRADLLRACLLAPASPWQQPASPFVPGLPIMGDSPAAGAVKEIPPAPSSLSIALSGLLTIGGCRLLNRVRQAHLAWLPEWYHSGGPDQVGHAVRFDLDFGAGVLAVCWHQPVCTTLTNPPFLHDRRLEHRSRWQRSYYLSSARRGPPSFTF